MNGLTPFFSEMSVLKRNIHPTNDQARICQCVPVKTTSPTATPTASKVSATASRDTSERAYDREVAITFMASSQLLEALDVYAIPVSGSRKGDAARSRKGDAARINN